jgi:cation transport ATPase
MPYCPKCGNDITDEMTFCPKCGATLKIAQGSAYVSTARMRRRDEKAEKDEKSEKSEKNEKHEHNEKHEKRGYSFLGPLIGGLILLFIGLTAFLEITNAAGKLMVAFFFVFVGVLILVGVIYGAVMAGRRHPRP